MQSKTARPKAELRILDESGSKGAVKVTGTSFVIGRSLECNLSWNDARMSKRHARIVPGEGGYSIEDLGSTNGTIVNGQLIEGKRPLAHGDEILCGDLRVQFLCEPEAPA